MSGPVSACPRCGLRREARTTAALCASCRSVLTPEELKLWRKP